MKKQQLSWIIAAINFFIILIFFSVPFWGFWEARIPFFFFQIPAWSLLYYFCLCVVIGFLVFLLNKIVAFRKQQRMLWFFREIPEQSNEIIIVTQAFGGDGIVYVNKTAEDYFDVQREDVINKIGWEKFLAEKNAGDVKFRTHPMMSGDKPIFTIYVAENPETAKE